MKISLHSMGHCIILNLISALYVHYLGRDSEWVVLIFLVLIFVVFIFLITGKGVHPVSKPGRSKLSVLPSKVSMAFDFYSSISTHTYVYYVFVFFLHDYIFMHKRTIKYLVSLISTPYWRTPELKICLSFWVKGPIRPPLEGHCYKTLWYSMNLYSNSCWLILHGKLLMP